MLLTLLKDIWKGRRAKVARAEAPATPARATAPEIHLTPVWRVYGDAAALQQPFHVAVIMPTVGRASLREAVQSVYDQEFPGRIQLLIGVDAPLGAFDEHEKLFAAAPAHVTVCFYYPGYSTSVRHGGLHPARDGGVLRAVLTYMANARHVAYLDDDNWWNPVHLQSLLVSIEGKEWAYSDRWFVHQDTRQVICADDWESVGPGRGLFARNFNGWVDPNCLMFDKIACEQAVRWWAIPRDEKAMSADRNVYAFLEQKSAPAASGLITTYYALQADDALQPYRAQMMDAHGSATVAGASTASPRSDAGIRFSFLLPTRNRIKGLSALLESIEATTARTDWLEIVLGIDEDDQATRDFVWDGLNIVKVIVPQGLTMGRLNQACYKASRGRYLMAMNDDVLLRTPKWDDKVSRVLDAVRDDTCLVHVNDLLFGQSLCCFPLVSRTYCEMAGGFCPEEYERYRIDDYIHEVFVMLRGHGHHRVFYLPGIVFEHLNYVPGDKGQRMYQLNREILLRDAQRFDAAVGARVELAEKLAQHIDGSRQQRLAAREKTVRRILG